MKHLKERLFRGDWVELFETEEDLVQLTFNMGRFQLWLNGSIIKISTNLKTIEKKFDQLLKNRFGIHKVTQENK